MSGLEVAAAAFSATALALSLAKTGVLIASSLSSKGEKISETDRRKQILDEVQKISKLLKQYGDHGQSPYTVEHIDDFQRCISALERADEFLARPRKKYFLLEVRQRDERIISSLLADLIEARETLQLDADFDYLSKGDSALNLDGVGIADAIQSAIITPDVAEKDSGSRSKLHLMAEPKETAKVEVILVHGLNGHYYRTWAGVASFWPRDFLSPDLKVCRIWSYGYNAVEALAVDGAGMELLAHDLIDRIVEKREKDDSHLPILWIAHSLGGLLVKTALKLSKNSGEMNGEAAAIFDTTIGAVFLGTPHHSTSSSSWATLCRTIAAITPYPRSAQSQNTSRNLGTLASEFAIRPADFKNLLEQGHIRIVSCFETLPSDTEYGPLKVVDTYNALGHSQEIIRRIDGADHLSMCKFQHPAEANYADLLCAMMDILSPQFLPPVSQSNLSPVFSAGARPFELELADAPLSIITTGEFRQVSAVGSDPEYFNLAADFSKFRKALENPWLVWKSYIGRDVGSCTWIERSKPFKEWYENGKRLLHLIGPPGCGKTTDAIFILDFLQANAERDPAQPSFRRRTVLSFFIGLEHATGKTYRDLLQALISQLLDLRPSFFRHVRPTLTREQIDTVAQGNTFGHGPQFPKPSDDALLEILLAMLYDPCHLDIFLVIDKLDECDELSASQIHGFFEQLQMIPSLKFAVTTTEGHISALIPKTLQASVSYIKIVEDEDISNGFQQDLERFIHSRTLKLPLDPALRRVRTKIESFLIEKRSRSFTWVILTLQRLSMGLSSGLSTASDIDNFLKSTKAPSKTLDQVYEQVIESVHERFRNILDRALCYMASATRPMKIEELRAVLTVSEEHKSLESVMAKRPVSLKGLLSTQLGHLLKFDGDTAYLASEDLRRFIRSVLQGKRSSWRKLSRFAEFSKPRNDAFNIVDNPAANFVSIQDNLLYDQEDIHVAIAGACISLLLLWEDLRENPRRPISMKPLRTPLFLKYARDEWMYHTREAGNKAWIVSGVIEKLWQKNRDRYFPTSSKPTQQSAITTAAGLAPVLENNGALLDGRSPGQISTQQPETTNHSEFTEDVLGRLSIALQVDNTLFDDVLREDTIRAVSGVWNFSSPGRNPTDSKALQQLIQSIKKLKIEAQDDLFNYTVRKCMHELVKLFIIHRIAYTKDAIKFKALDIAVSVQSIEMVRRLLDSDYISRFDRDDISHALLLAAGKANEPICRLLLNHDHAIDTPNAQGGTPLHLAASTDNLALAELLIDWGANLFARDKKGCMPIHVAAESGCIPVMEFFLSIASQVAETDDDGRSPLYLACAAGQFSAAELLLSYGANVSQANNTHKIPLHAAVKPGADQIVKLLLANGTPIESRDHRGRHPLHVACMNGWALVVKDLLAAGADAEARDDDEKTPLMHACTPNSTFNKPNVASAAVVQMLLEANVEVGHSTKDGRTALHFAAEYGTPAVLQLLLEAKANPNRKDKQGKSSLHAACDAKTSFEPKMRILVRYGGDLNQEDLGKESPLATVRRSKGVDVVNRIINEKRKTSESTQNVD